MRFFVILTSLFAAAQAEMFLNAPSFGTTLQAGQKVTVEVVVPVNNAGQKELEVSLVIGFLACPSTFSTCASAIVDMGEIVFVGKIQPQGLIWEDLFSFEDISVVIPRDLSGTVTINVQRVSLLSTPGHTTFNTDYAENVVQVTSGSSGSLNIHPNGNSAKCVGILGGTYADGTAVDVYDCNGSNTQKWQWNGDALTSINPVDNSQWCLDAGVKSQWANGVRMKIWQCFSGLPQQTWTPVTTSGTIKLTTANFCLDLTNGITTNRNVLQIWTCGGGNTNQIWTVTSA